jgi:hypothetical protein
MLAGYSVEASQNNEDQVVVRKPMLDDDYTTLHMVIKQVLLGGQPIIGFIPAHDDLGRRQAMPSSPQTSWWMFQGVIIPFTRQQIT